MSERIDLGRPTSDTRRPHGRWTWLVPLAFVGLCVLLYFTVEPVRSFFDEAYDALSSDDEQQIRSWVEQYGGWGFAVIVALMLLQTVVAFLPSIATMVVAVLAYGPFLGGLLAWGGMLLAASLAYGIGAALGSAVVGRLMSNDTEAKMEHFVSRYGGPGIVAARISPVLSTDAVSIAAGLVRMGYPKFILATAVGTAPLSVLIAWLGSDIDRLWPGLVALSVASLAAFIGYVIWDRNR